MLMLDYLLVQDPHASFVYSTGVDFCNRTRAEGRLIFLIAINLG